MAKLTPENRKWIIEKHKTGKYTQAELAGEDISQQAVSHILKIAGLVKPREWPKDKCIACGTKFRDWHNYEICGDKDCAQAYGEAAQCKPKDPMKILLIQRYFEGVIPEWGEIHFKGSSFVDRIKEYSLFNSKREHVAYHWEIIKYGTREISKKTGRSIDRQNSNKPIWDGVETEPKWYRPALDSGHTFGDDEEEGGSKRWE